MDSPSASVAFLLEDSASDVALLDSQAGDQRGSEDIPGSDAIAHTEHPRNLLFLFFFFPLDIGWALVRSLIWW